jgi:hypothetical protein
MRRRQHRMRRVLHSLGWALLSFVLLQLLLGWRLESGSAGRRDPDYALKEERLRALLPRRPGRPLVVALGSSRTLLGLAAARVRPALVFNFGLTGAGPLLERLCLTRLLAAGIRPDFVLVEVLPALLHQADASPVEEDWLDGSRLRLDELAALWPDHSHPSRLLGAWGRSRLLPCYRDRAGLGAGLGFKVPTAVALAEGLDSHGWYQYPASRAPAANHRRRLQMARAQYVSDNPAGNDRLRLAGGPAWALRALLARCRDEGIPAALLLMPEGSEFQGFLAAPVRAGLDAFLIELARSERVPLIDARNWVGDAGFWDGHHLLPEGAVTFTRRLEREVLPPLLEPSSVPPPLMPAANR